jgi:hypothetical protein
VPNAPSRSVHVSFGAISVWVMSHSDLPAARALLDGYSEEDRCGRRRTKYFKRGSSEETEARQALAKHLRGGSPVDQTVRMHLANLFDPPKWQQRKIEIVSCRKGPQTDHVRNAQIAQYVWDKVSGGALVTDAIPRAAKQFAISEDMVKKKWAIYRPLFEADRGPLPRRCKTGN